MLEAKNIVGTNQVFLCVATIFQLLFFINTFWGVVLSHHLKRVVEINTDTSASPLPRSRASSKEILPEKSQSHQLQQPQALLLPQG